MLKTSPKISLHLRMSVPDRTSKKRRKKKPIRQIRDKMISYFRPMSSIYRKRYLMCRNDWLGQPRSRDQYLAPVR